MKITVYTEKGPAEGELVAQTVAQAQRGPVLPALASGVSIEQAQGLRYEEVVLAQISGWPEAKVEMELSCVDLPIVGKVCTNLPRSYARNCTKKLVAQIGIPDNADAQAIAAARECALGALGAGVLGALGNPAAAIPAFKAYLIACLSAKAIGIASQIEANLLTRDECESWHPV